MVCCQWDVPNLGKKFIRICQQLVELWAKFVENYLCIVTVKKFLLKIPLSASRFGSPGRSNQLVLVTHTTPPPKTFIGIRPKLFWVRPILRTDRQTDITSSFLMNGLSAANYVQTYIRWLKLGKRKKLAIWFICATEYSYKTY